MRTWMSLTAAALLAVPFTWSPLRADAETNDKKIEKLQTEVSALKKELNDLKDEVRDNSVRGLKIAADLQEIKKMLGEMADRQTAITRKAGYDPRSLQPGGPMPAATTITLKNEFLAPAVVHINGQAFSVAVNETRIIQNVPVGPFQYFVEVGGRMVEPPRSETLQPAGYTITIFARPPF